MKDDNNLLDMKRFKWFIADNNIEQLAINAFWVNFENYKKECSDEFDVYFKCFKHENLSINIQTISVKLGNWPDCNCNHIVVNIPIMYKNHHIGGYDVLFTFTGEIDDDYFVIY